MGRAIVRNPQVLLMDEPLSNLDAKLRVQMRAEIARIQREIAATTIYVTHDQVEAMTMGDRVVVMRKGEVQQVDEPQAIYERPANLFVATFIGSPPMNLIKGTLLREAHGFDLLVGTQRLTTPAGLAAANPALERYAGSELGVGVRPEHVREAAAGGDPSVWRLRGDVEATELLGSDLLVYLALDAEPIMTAEVIEVAADIDAASVDELQLEAERSRTPVVCRFDAASAVRIDDTIEIAFSTERLHFFDLETGLAIRPG
jgi:multiple sugar transport system ATP-binding protein